MDDKKTNEINKMISAEYMKTVEDVSEHIINRNLQNKSFELLNLFKKALVSDKEEFKKYKNVYDFYKKTIIKFSFISLPLLDDKDVINLIENYFTWQFKISEYDFLSKFHFKLINIEIIEERDKFKNTIKKILLDKKEVITSRAKLRTVADWLRNYNSKLGLGPADNLKRMQYITSLNSYKGLDDSEVSKLKILFTFYENLKLSSLTPQGFEAEPPVVIKDKLYIFRQGNLEPVNKNVNKNKIFNKVETPENDTTVELKNMLNQYKEGSLEYKAIEEEITELETKGEKKKIEE